MTASFLRHIEPRHPWHGPCSFLVPPGTKVLPRMNRILIVEDNPRIREGLQAPVENAGLRPASASDYPGAAELLLPERFDLLITDLALPGGTGVLDRG